MENAVSLPGKSTTQNITGLKRPALGEIGNKLDKFAVPNQRNGVKKTQPSKSTYVKDQSKLTKLVKADGKPQLRPTVSSSSLFSVNIHQEPEVKIAPTGKGL